MEILVNNEPLDYTLENERSLGEVIDGIASWLESGRFAITGLDVDQRSYAIHDRSSWQDLSLETVSRVALEALPLDEVDQATLAAVDEYLGLLSDATTGGQDEAFSELSGELPFVRKRIAGYFPELSSNDGADLLHAPWLDAGRLPRAGERSELSAQIERLRAVINSRVREYVEPDREARSALRQLTAMSSEIVDTPILLQTGRRPEGMRVVVKLTEVLSKVMRLVPRLSDERIDVDAIRAFAREIVEPLTEMQEAFEADDTVLVGDLLEYEIAPRLGRIASLVSEGPL